MKLLIKRATVHAAGDKFVVSAGNEVISTHSEYCIACEECEAYNDKQRNRLTRNRPLAGEQAPKQVSPRRSAA